MSVTVVNDYYFKPDGDIAEGKNAAADLVRYFNESVPEVQLSLWLEDRDNANHHFHVTVFDSVEALEQLKASEAIQLFVERLYPNIARTTHLAPLCDVWLASGRGVDPVPHRR